MAAPGDAGPLLAWPRWCALKQMDPIARRAFPAGPAFADRLCALCFSRSKGVAGRSYTRRLRLPSTLGAQMLHYRTEKISEKTPFLGIELVEQLSSPARLPAGRSRPVAARESNSSAPRRRCRSCDKRASESKAPALGVYRSNQIPTVGIEELPAVIAVKAQDGKRQRRFDLRRCAVAPRAGCDSIPPGSRSTACGYR